MANGTNGNRVPLIESQALSEFGDLREQAAFYDPQGMDRDYTYVPGFSEMRREHAVKAAEYRAGRIPRGDVPVLPVNLRWARCQSKSGDPDNTKSFSHGRIGYRLATKDDIGQPWLKEMPGAAQVMADGTIRNGDTILMVATREAAARNELHRRIQTEERLEGAKGSFAQEIEKTRQQNPGLNIKGLNPTVEVLPPTEREASLPPQPVSVKSRDGGGVTATGVTATPSPTPTSR